jgi:hypothetical protein
MSYLKEFFYNEFVKDFDTKEIIHGIRNVPSFLVIIFTISVFFIQKERYSDLNIFFEVPESISFILMHFYIYYQTIIGGAILNKTFYMLGLTKFITYCMINNLKFLQPFFYLIYILLLITYVINNILYGANYVYNVHEKMMRKIFV